MLPVSKRYKNYVSKNYFEFKQQYEHFYMFIITVLYQYMNSLRNDVNNLFGNMHAWIKIYRELSRNYLYNQSRNSCCALRMSHVYVLRKFTSANYCFHFCLVSTLFSLYVLFVSGIALDLSVHVFLRIQTISKLQLEIVLSRGVVCHSPVYHFCSSCKPWPIDLCRSVLCCERYT